MSKIYLHIFVLLYIIIVYKYSAEKVKCVKRYKNENATTELCDKGCANSTCIEGKYTSPIINYDCYSNGFCVYCYHDGMPCDARCKKVHYKRNTCSEPCHEDYCNDKSKSLITTTTTTAATTTTTNITTTTTAAHRPTNTTHITAVTDERSYISKMMVIDGWVNGTRKPFSLANMNAELCELEKRNQTSLELAMKICIQNGSNCNGGITLCYQSRMSGIQNLDFNIIKVIVNRTAPFRLDHIPGNQIDELCNRKSLWPEGWVHYKNHGFNLSSNGKVVEIRTSYNNEISIANLNAKGCAVFQFDRNRTTEGEGTKWRLKNPKAEKKKFDEKPFWSNLRSGGMKLHKIDPLVALPYDLLTGVGVGSDQKIFTVFSPDQNIGQCWMRITFHPECLGKCLSTTNWDDNEAGTWVSTTSTERRVTNTTNIKMNNGTREQSASTETSSN